MKRITAKEYIYAVEHGTLDELANETRTPSESEEQKKLLRFCMAELHNYPELEMLYHVPNEGKRSISSGKLLKSEGLRKGVPDLCLPVARSGFHGLYIELKRIDGGRVSADQKNWIDKLQKQGYAAFICHGWKNAWSIIKLYLNNELKKKSGEE